MLERLTKIICEYTGNEAIAITESTVLIANLEIDSLDLVNLVCLVEDEFDIEISDRAIKNLKKVGDVIAYIQKQQNE
jgi:acyl carrier protein